MGNMATAGCDVESGCFAARQNVAASQIHCEYKVEEVPAGAAQNSQNSVKQTVIIFDWDDTLMCSSEIKSKGGHVSDQEIMLLQAAVRNVLLVALQLGRTCIVTNANMAWVHSTTNLFMPALVPVLAFVDIRSARQSSDRPARCKTQGKFAVFQDLCVVADDSQDTPRTEERRDTPRRRGGNSPCRSQSSPRRSQNSPRRSKNTPRRSKRSCSNPEPPSHVNLVILGDSNAEIEAAAMFGRRARSSFVKTVKFKSDPTCSELLGQLLAVAQHLRALVAENMNRHLELVVDAAQPGLWYMVESESEEVLTVRTPRAAHCL